MHYNELGNTGLRLSEVSFGAGSSAGLMIHGDSREQTAAVAAALEAGINHFDTAAFYGYGASEVYLGQALRAAAAQDVLITSKVAIGREFLQTRQLRKCVRRSVEESLSRLRRETIDILLIHNATHRTHRHYDPDHESARVAQIMNEYIPAVTFDDLVGEDSVLEEVEELIKEGKVRQFGLSGQNNDPMVIRALIATGKIAIFNQPYSLFNPSAGFPEARENRKLTGPFARDQRELFIEFDDVMEDARKANIGVSVISALGAGALTEDGIAGASPDAVSRRDNRFPFDGQFERMACLARQFKPIAEQAGMSLTELAIRFVKSTPGVTTMVAGLSNEQQVKELLQHTDKPALPQDVIEALPRVWFGPGLAE